MHLWIHVEFNIWRDIHAVPQLQWEISTDEKLIGTKLQGCMIRAFDVLVVCVLFSNSMLTEMQQIWLIVQVNLS